MVKFLNSLLTLMKLVLSTSKPNIICILFISFSSQNVILRSVPVPTPHLFNLFDENTHSNKKLDFSRDIQIVPAITDIFFSRYGPKIKVSNFIDRNSNKEHQQTNIGFLGFV